MSDTEPKYAVGQKLNWLPTWGGQREITVDKCHGRYAAEYRLGDEVVEGPEQFVYYVSWPSGYNTTYGYALESELSA